MEKPLESHHETGQLAAFFPHEPTLSQKGLFSALDTFFRSNIPRSVFVLQGYAGTGKTSCLAALVKAMESRSKRPVLMAPTGRAAKMMSLHAGAPAHTIHKRIYEASADTETGAVRYALRENTYKKGIFIVDEASMIGRQISESGRKSLLADLVTFVFQGEFNKLILVGDIAQLPPVGETQSAALDSGYLESNFQLSVTSYLLNEVKRQQLESGILYNATGLRNLLEQEKPEIALTTTGFKDVFKMTGERLEDGLRYAYQKFGVDNTVVVTRSNKAAVQYNLYIRRAIRFAEDELEVGDLLMVVKNNYFWLSDDSPAGFLANGEFMTIKKVKRYEERYGLRFAFLELELPDVPAQSSFEACVMLDVIYSGEASMKQADLKRLYNEISNDHAGVAKGKALAKLIKSDPFLNALQVKFAYALTCHKSQGGQWKAVFLDQGYIGEDMPDREFLRWLYTAVTRASAELFLVNFQARFFK